MSKKQTDDTKRQPWLKFYTADWRADPGLRMCSIGARGIWIDMLSIMHEADPYGHLLVAGMPPNPADLARLLGGGTAEEYAVHIADLERRNVFSRTKKGIIYSRRMKQDAEKSNIFKEFGRRGGNPNIVKSVNPPVNPTPNPRVNPTLNSTLNGGVKLRARGSTARVQSLDKQESVVATCLVQTRADEPAPRPMSLPQMPARNAPLEQWMHLGANGTSRETDYDGVTHPTRNEEYVDVLVELCCKAAKINEANWKGDWRPILAWLDAGINGDVIVDVITEIASRPAYPKCGSFMYFDARIRETWQKSNVVRFG